ncbi:hypothetical protein ASC95_18330 [Pelomonas sp. Root1217]|uniref:TonB-dependent receptor n=1 Tax=Pelomonas sp. Root1217 TaxID=1736430 RepID=UPI0007097073|nr:TonB-dependent receptor [Pelomonas sp. Root1217]KQV47941.1 hypothetical protein ASC95_18330 [Pelomonas sp. Root1217]
MKNQFRTTAIYRGVVQLALLGAGGAAFAQATAPAAPAAPATLDTVVITGQRRALQTAQEIKRNADEIVDSVVADEAGKLPDRSITEVLQRVVGVTVQRQRTINNDASHFSEEGSGIRIRGLGWGLSNLNGREIFSAGWPGKDLSWGAVTPELMVGVDTYKNPSAEQIEGAVSGIVNLRTGLPFDYGSGTTRRVSFGSSYIESTGKFSPQVSGLYATSWDNDFGRWGVVVDLARNQSTYESESLSLNPYYPRTDIVPNKTVYIPGGASWGVNVGDSKRNGFYGALQWKKNDKQSSVSYFLSKGLDRDTGSNMYTGYDGNLATSIYHVKVDNAVVDENGAVVSGHYSYPFRTGTNPDGSVDYNFAGKGANNFVDGGIPMGTSRSFNEHHSQTGELAWNFKWAVNDRLGIQTDLQWVNSKFETNGHEVQLATFMPSMDIAVHGGDPVQFSYDQKTQDFLANSANYYWNLIQPTRLKGDSNLYAAKLDVKFKFDDPVLRDVRVGWRSSYRNSYREQATFLTDPSSGGWQSIAEPWNVGQTHTPGQVPKPSDQATWQRGGNFAYLSDPKYQYPTEVFSFANINNGKFGNLPSVVFPTYDLMRDYPNAYNKLMTDVRLQQCLDGVKNGLGNSDPVQATKDCNTNYGKPFDGTLVYGQSLNGNRIGKANLTTHAIYTNLRFGFDEWKIPVEGNIGVRAAYVSAVSHGNINFDPSYSTTTPPDVPVFDKFTQPLDVAASHVDWLPSLNLKASFTDRLQGRIAMARSIYRPDFRQMQESITLEQKIDTTNHQVTYTGKNSGNAKLKPLTADSFDVTLEWYPKDGQSLTGGVFYKKVKDLVYDSAYTRTFNTAAGTPQIFTISGPANMAKAEAAGFEISASSYLDHFDFLKDKLPDWVKGFGVSANYSYVDSAQHFYRDAQLAYCPAESSITNSAMKSYGCDTNGQPYSKLPMEGVTKHAANFALRYDRGRFSARLAYNWNSRVMLGIYTGGNGSSSDPARVGKTDTWFGIPKWQEAYGQWDGGLSYSFTDKFGMGLSVSNLNKVMVRETLQQASGEMGTRWRFPGRSYYLSGNYSF